jgi:RNA polymerase sigma factor (sigma-70 family)
MATSQMSNVLRHLHRTALLREGADLTDGDLLGRFVDQQDAAAFEALVRRHGPMVLGVCRRLLHSHQDAEDAFQATFLVLVRRAAAVRPRALVANWLHGVAYRTALKARTLAARRGRRETQVTDMPEPPVSVAEPWDELRPILDQELSRLADKFRVPIVLCLLEGTSHKEAARQLGWPQGTLAGRLSRGRALLARRLARRGVVLSAGALALLLAEKPASAHMPPALVVSTVEAASLLAAGKAATGLISAPVAALTEGVVRAMTLTRYKLPALGLVVVLLAGLGTGPLTRQVVAGKPAGDPPVPRADGRIPQPPPAIAGTVVQVAPDGKSFTLEVPPATRGEEPTKAQVKLTEKTQIAYGGVGPGGATLTVGYGARVWMADGKDVATQVHLQGKETTRRGPNVTGKVAAVSPEGTTITFRIPPRTRSDDEKVQDVRLTDKTIVTYSYIARGGTKPAEGYTADVWLEEGSQTAAERVNFLGNEERPARGVVEPEPDSTGRVVAAAADGKTFSVAVPSRNRGEEPAKRDFKIDDKTQLVYLSVGAGGDRPSEGYTFRLWLAPGSKDTAARVVFQGVPKERYTTLYGKVVGVAADGRGVTLETRPSGREEPPRHEVKFTDKTRVVYQGVGPDGAKLTAGYIAQLELEDGSSDTVRQVLFTVPGGRR